MDEQLIAKGQEYIMGTYKQAPIVVESGEGVYVTDTTERNT